jgi:glutaredoxin
MNQVTVYSREGCHLCEDLLADLRELAAEHAFEIDVRDVDSKTEWRERYDARVPVVECGGKFVCEYFLDKETLLSSLTDRNR